MSSPPFGGRLIKLTNFIDACALHLIKISDGNKKSGGKKKSNFVNKRYYCFTNIGIIRQTYDDRGEGRTR